MQRSWWVWTNPWIHTRHPNQISAEEKIHITGEDLDRWEDVPIWGKNRIAAMVLAYLSGVDVHDDIAWHPTTWNDVQACEALRNVIPQVRKSWAKLATVDPVWDRIVRDWDGLVEASQADVVSMLYELGC